VFLRPKLTVGGSDGQAVGLREVPERLIVLFARPKPLGELLRGQVAAVVGAGGVVKLLEQVVEFVCVAQRQAKGEV
jgi:hypothetical protein